MAQSGEIAIRAETRNVAECFLPGNHLGDQATRDGGIGEAMVRVPEQEP
jgi:hypothetical protein